MTLVGKILRSIANIFRSSAEAAWVQLGKEAQDQSLTAAKAVQIFKTNLTLTYESVKSLTATSLRVSTDVVDSWVLHIAGEWGYKPEAGVIISEEAWKFIQDKANTLDSDGAWASFFQSSMKFLATFLSSGKLDWVTLSFGIAQIAYDKISK